MAPAIHTISFNCNDNVANTFLSQLAADNRGRFHAFHPSDLTAQKFVHSLSKDESEKTDYAVSFYCFSLLIAAVSLFLQFRRSSFFAIQRI